MRKCALAACIVVVLGLAGCENNGNERMTSNGLSYTVIEEGTGDAVAKGEYMLLNMSYKDNADSVWMTTAESGIPVTIYKKDSVWLDDDGSIQEIFYNLKTGDSIMFDVSAKDLFTKTWRMPIPATVDSTAVITFNIGVERIMNQEELRTWQSDLMQKQQAKMAEEAEVIKVEDDETIAQYLKDEGIEAQKTESGIYYVMHEEGQGEMPEAGDQVYVHYAGRLLEGAYFDASIKDIAQEQGLYNPAREPYEPLDFPIGKGAVIKGWDEGIGLLKPGGKATIYIPSGLGYGQRGNGPKIPANSILVFDVELVKVEKGA